MRSNRTGLDYSIILIRALAPIPGFRSNLNSEVPNIEPWSLNPSIWITLQVECKGLADSNFLVIEVETWGSIKMQVELENYESFCSGFNLKLGCSSG